MRPGESFRLDLDDHPGDSRRAAFPHPELSPALTPGTTLLLDDGRIRLTVTGHGEGFVETEVVVGGELSDRKGVNVPGVVLPLSSMSEKDLRDAILGLELGVDWIARSFVQRAADADELRSLVAGRCGIMAKLEKPAALEALDSIVSAFDAVMVARGDLGVEMPPGEDSDRAAAHRAGVPGERKPVVVATQMLESMVSSPVPTRAEASDVATAVYEGADVVMLSAETAAGQYPVESVTIMNRLIEQVEGDEYYRHGIEDQGMDPEATVADAICYSLKSTAQVLSTPVVVTYTASGFSAERAARERPHVPILALTPFLGTARRLALVWGVHPVRVRDIANEREMVDLACEVSVREGAAHPGERIVIAAGVPFGTSGTTNLIQVAEIPSVGSGAPSLRRRQPAGDRRRGIGNAGGVSLSYNEGTK